MLYYRSMAKKKESESTIAARAMAKKRWSKTTKKERSDFARSIAKQGAGRKRFADRCPCGTYTAAHAKKRNHVCQAGRVDQIPEEQVRYLKTGLPHDPPTPFDSPQTEIERAEAEYAASLVSAQPTPSITPANGPCSQCGRLPELHQSHGGPIGHNYEAEAIRRAPSV